MVKNHLKRLAVPKSWDIKRKENKFIVRPSSGGSKLEHSMPLLVVFRDIFEKAKTLKEMKFILNNKEILLNGTRVKKHDASVGLMDVVSIPETKESYRMLINKKGKITFVPADPSEANITFLKIANKSKVKGGKIQFNFSNGKNMVSEKNSYSTGDVLVVENPGNKIKEHLKLEKGNFAYLTGGKHIGTTGKVEEIKGNNLVLKSTENDLFETSKKYAFIIGKDKPIIALSK
jgi:small subunit ribosomal protein S4e